TRQGGPLWPPVNAGSRTVGTRRGNRIRIYQREGSGNLQMAVWDPERKRYRQVSLGYTDRVRATREAAEMVRLRDAGETSHVSGEPMGWSHYGEGISLETLSQT